MSNCYLLVFLCATAAAAHEPDPTGADVQAFVQSSMSASGSPANESTNIPQKTAQMIIDDTVDAARQELIGNNTILRAGEADGKTAAPFECPDAWTQIGPINADVSGCGLQACNQRYGKKTMKECAAFCTGNGNCKSFTWAPVHGDRNHLSSPVCSIYDATTHTATWGPKQIMCKKPNAFATNGDVPPFNKCSNSIHYEPITSLAECKAMIPLFVPGGYFVMGAGRQPYWARDGPPGFWPPGCFRYKGVNGLQVYLGTNPAGTGSVGEVMVCKLKSPRRA